MGKENLTMEGLKAEWKELCEKGCQEFLMPGNKVMDALQAGLNETGASLQDLHVAPENLISLYYILLGISYLEADAIFTCPLDITAGKTEQGKAVSAILKRKGATAGLPIPVEGISAFAAAILEGLSEEFQSMDGRFIVDATSYGTSQIENPAGENTVTLYLGYYTEKNNSILTEDCRFSASNLEKVKKLTGFPTHKVQIKPPDCIRDFNTVRWFYCLFMKKQQL